MKKNNKKRKAGKLAKVEFERMHREFLKKCFLKRYAKELLPKYAYMHWGRLQTDFSDEEIDEASEYLLDGKDKRLKRFLWRGEKPYTLKDNEMKVLQEIVDLMKDLADEIEELKEHYKEKLLEKKKLLEEKRESNKG